jgi:hypothetical protein
VAVTAAVVVSGPVPAIITVIAIVVIRPVIPGIIVPGAIVPGVIIPRAMIPGMIVPGIPVTVIAPAVGIVPTVPEIIITPRGIVIPGGVGIGIVPRPRRRFCNGDNRIGRRKTHRSSCRDGNGVSLADDVGRGILCVCQKVVYGIV